MEKQAFNPKIFESKWRKRWAESRLYKTPKINSGDKKYYSLYSFPYPSGAGLHVGHVEGMVANDIPARFERMRGKKVTLPMGWDSFGLPAENYAIKTGIHPYESTEEVIKTFVDQIQALGISVDWDTELAAHRPDYYKWTQWIFLQLYKKGLAYKKKAPVNWCPQDNTVLANEQVLNDGTCERCGSEVIQKDMEQWFFKITEYADRLDSDLDKVDWPESTKIQQRNWIGKSAGAQIKFSVISEDSQKEITKLTVFSTAHETITGATFMVVAPENNFLKETKKNIRNWAEIEKYIEETKKKTELERQQQKDKTGVEIKGIKAINPITKKQIPIYTADYVLNGYGTGAIMAVPGHDERDFGFATKYGIDIIYLTSEQKLISYSEEIKNNPENFIMMNSFEFDGMNFKDGREQVMNKLKKLGIGEEKTQYRLRDWLVSRQRYWGAPIPIVYDPEGNAHPVAEEDLPVLLPNKVDFKPTGESPLLSSEEFHKSAEEKYGKGYRREVDTMDTFVDSSWYFFRYMDSKNDSAWASSENMNNWLPTDLYMIGSEHTVLHLLYSRFFTKFFFDEGLIDFDEPFYRLRHMGLVLGPDGRKMSKRWGNVINPTDEIAKFGADTLRIYEMFMGPLEEPKAWNTNGEQGVYRFLSRVWDQQYKVVEVYSSQKQEIEINKLIKKVTLDIPNLSFNTAIAKMMEFINFLAKEEKISKSVWEKFVKVIAPFAPYIAEELWEILGNKESVHLQKWPSFDEKMTVDAVSKIAIQINGKVRGVVEIDPHVSEDTIYKMALEIPGVKKYITKQPTKKIYIKGKILNIIF